MGMWGVLGLIALCGHLCIVWWPAFGYDGVNPNMAVGTPVGLDRQVRTVVWGVLGLWGVLLHRAGDT